MTPFSMGPFCWKSTAKRVQNHLFFRGFVGGTQAGYAGVDALAAFGIVRFGRLELAVTSMMKGLEEVVHFGQSISIKVQRFLKGTS